MPPHSIRPCGAPFQAARPVIYALDAAPCLTDGNQTRDTRQCAQVHNGLENVHQQALGRPISALQMSCAQGLDAVPMVRRWPSWERRPILSRMSLEAWVEATDISAEETQQRHQVALTILDESTFIDGHDSMCSPLQILDDLDIACYPALTELPEGLSVGGNFDCSYCTNLTSLPAGLSVGGDLDCNHCTSLTRLPERLSVGGNIDCNHCTSLRQLPRGLNIINGDLDCSHCTNLVRLPDRLSVLGHLNCSDCTSLTQLPEGLSVRRRLTCSSCTALMQLPERLHVGGNLYCNNCTALAWMPVGLRIHGDVYLANCTGLTGLPVDFMTGRGYAVASRVRAIRRIELTGSAIAETDLRLLMQAAAPGLQFYFGMAPAGRDISGFADLGQAATFWQSQATPRIVPNFESWGLPAQDYNFLLQFLSRLRSTADYTNLQARKRLTERVCDLLQAMDESPELRRICSDCISDALQSCGDRVIWAMNQMETAVRVHQAQQNPDPEVLKELVLSFLRLEIVQHHARHKASTLTWVDEIEVFLAYESGLRQALELPVSAEHMLFARCAQVTLEDLRIAYRAVIDAMHDPVRTAAYLRNSPLWQRRLRRQTAARWNWASLTVQAVPGHIQVQDLRCPITLEPLGALSSPVMWQSGNACLVYEAADFMQHWVEHGTEPTTRQSMELAQLQRPLTNP
ncbi:hypothetical protein Q3G72_031900 [Acer saccharum]|nr:hypothetical protein Q3G72_031900 [Acer saccharum]